MAIWKSASIAAASIVAANLFAAPAQAQPAAATGDAVYCNVSPLPPLAFEFQSERRFASGDMPLDIATAELDGDDPPDLVTADGGSATLSALLNDGAGGFGAPLTGDSGAGPGAVATGDFDGDGVADAATADRDAGSVSVFINDGEGGLEISSTVADLRVVPEAMTAADLDNDGDIDLAVTGPSVAAGAPPVPRQAEGDGDVPLGPAVTFAPNPVEFGTVTVGNTATRTVSMTNNTMASVDVIQPFSSPDPDFTVPADNCVGTAVLPGASCSFTVTWTPSAAGIDTSTVGTNLPAVGMDVGVDVIGQGVQPSVNVVTLYNQGNGQFTVNQSFGNVAQPSAISAADHDGNGLADLAIAASATETVNVFTNIAGSFSSARMQVSPVSGQAPAALAPADFDCDGDVDMGVANLGSDNVSILDNTDGGALGEVQVLDAVANPAALTAGDFDGDGVPDLAAANLGEVVEVGDDIPDEVTLLRNDGAGAFSAGSAFGVGEGPVGITASDLNGDGLTDIATANSVSDDVSVLLTQLRMTTLSIAGVQLGGSIGGDSVYTQFNIANAGDFAAGGLVFMTELPAGLSLEAGYNRAPSCSVGEPDGGRREVRCVADEIPEWQCDTDGQLLVCELERLPPGGKAPLVVHGRTGGGTFTVDGEVAADNAEPQTASVESGR